MKGKVGLITGGTAGIGPPTSKLLQQAGAQGVIASRNGGTLKAVQTHLALEALVI